MRCYEKAIMFGSLKIWSKNVKLPTNGTKMRTKSVGKLRWSQIPNQNIKLVVKIKFSRK